MDLITESLPHSTGGSQYGTWNAITFLWPTAIILISAVTVPALLRLLTNNPGPSSEKICSGSTVSRKDYENVVEGLLRGISYQPPDLELNVGLKTRVEDYLESRRISPELMMRIDPCICAATEIANFTYSFVSPDVQEAIAIYTTCTIAIDDLTSGILPELEKYTTQLILGHTPEHELLRVFTEVLQEQQRVFGPFSGDMIVKNSLEFVAAAGVERNQHNLHLPSEASDYMDFLRVKTGITESFAFFCFPEETNPEDGDLARYVVAIPSLMLYLSYANDVLSFYKEELAAEDCPGFINNHARMHGCSRYQSLCEIRNRTIEVVRRIRSILSFDTAMAEAINRFIHGYVFYHLCARRYKLDRLDIPAVFEARGRVREMESAQR